MSRHQRAFHGSTGKAFALCVQDFPFERNKDEQRRSLGDAGSAPAASAAASVCIRLWFPSVLYDHQSSQLILTAVAHSENHQVATISLSRGQFYHVFYSSEAVFTTLHGSVVLLLY